MGKLEDPGMDEFEGLDLRNLQIDQAWLRIRSQLDRPTWLYVRSDDCYKCAYKLLEAIGPNSSNISLVVETQNGWSLRIRDDNATESIPDQPDSNSLCQVYASMGQFGVYDLNTTCDFATAKEPVDIYMSLLACFLFFVILAIVWIALELAYSRGIFDRFFKRLKCSQLMATKKDSSNQSDSARGEDGRMPSAKETDADGAINKKKTSTRLKSLDTFRGLSIIVMIFVNDGGGGYFFFDHATWNGLQVADLVFPWFMWIMGAAMPISLRSSYRRNETKLKIFVNIFRRSCILFLLGLINNTLGGYNNLLRLRIPGVLQRFAISYFVVATVALLFTPKDLSVPQGSSKMRRALHDVIVLWPQWIFHLIVVAGHCFITFFLPVLDGDCPTGYLGPAGLARDAEYPPVCVGGAAGYIDRWFFGLNHMYRSLASRKVYGSGPYDPEGILGSMLCIFQVFLGLQAGMIVLIFSDWKSRAARWIAWSILTGTIGTVLCLASKEEGWIPVNKNLWSLSFVLVTTCFAFFLLVVCFVLIDVLKWWNGAPFLHPGMNSILMYVGHQWTYNLFPWHYQYGPMNTHFDKLVETLWGVSLWVIIATWLFYKKTFISI